MDKHLDKYTISRYVSNHLTPDQETMVQEHISSCHKCRDEVSRYRALVHSLESEDKGRKITLRIVLKSTAFRVAASLIIVAGVTFAILNTRPDTLPIQSGHDSGTILSTDTYSPDSTQTQQSDSTHTAPPEYYYNPTGQ